MSFKLVISSGGPEFPEKVRLVLRVDFSVETKVSPAATLEDDFFENLDKAINEFKKDLLDTLEWAEA